MKGIPEALGIVQNWLSRLQGFGRMMSRLGWRVTLHQRTGCDREEVERMMVHACSIRDTFHLCWITWLEYWLWSWHSVGAQLMLTVGLSIAWWYMRMFGGAIRNVNRVSWNPHKKTDSKLTVNPLGGRSQQIKKIEIPFCILCDHHELKVEIYSKRNCGA